MRFTTNMTSQDWETPAQAWREIAKHIPQSEILFDPFVCSGRSRIYLQDLGYSVIEAKPCLDKTSNGTCECMNVELDPTVTCLITNPPFDEIESTIEWFQASGQKWVLLVPEVILKRHWFKKKVDEYKIIRPRNRIHFIQNGRVRSYCPFESVWIMVGDFDKTKRDLSQPEDLEFKRFKSMISRWNEDPEN